MPRFFIPACPENTDTLIIAGDDARHIARSLRMAVGDTVTVLCGDGLEHECTLTRIRDEECECKVQSARPGSGEPPASITLYIAYPKGDKLELVVQKAVELGATKITPFESKRCIKRPKEDRREKQTARLSRIAEEAAKQCGRAIIPEVTRTVSFDEMLSLAKEADIPLFCYEGEGCISLKQALYNNKEGASISVIVGCEGGFAPEEAVAAKEAGLTPVNLGPRILRCETAPMYALSAISYEIEL